MENEEEIIRRIETLEKEVKRLNRRIQEIVEAYNLY